jgi:hypothetical protein
MLGNSSSCDRRCNPDLQTDDHAVIGSPDAVAAHSWTRPAGAAGGDQLAWPSCCLTKRLASNSSATRLSLSRMAAESTSASSRTPMSS